MRLSAFVTRAAMAVLVFVLSCSSGEQESGLLLSLSEPPDGTDSVAYEISCEDGQSFSGNFEVKADRDPPIWQAFIGLPEGECDITLTASNAQGEAICTGSTTVTVVANQTVKADITLDCGGAGAEGRGNIDIDGRFTEIVVNECPVIHFLGAIPSVIPEGETQSSIELRVSDRDPGPEPLTWTISASEGSIADPNATDTVFTCPTVGGGRSEITAVATDGDPQCEKSRSIYVVCPDAGNACEGVDCSDGNECTEDLCDPATGNCSNPSVADGTACDADGAAGVCMSGSCEAASLCEGVDCSDGNECTEDLCDPATGNCSNPSVADGTVCDADGAAGTCQSGSCEAVNLCEGVDCSDGNECTEDLCDPATGNCSNPSVADGTACDGGTCEAGQCVAEPPDPQEVTGNVLCTLPFDLGVADVAVDLVVSPSSAWSSGSTVDVAFEASTVIPASLGQLLIDLGTDKINISSLLAELSVDGGTPTPVEVTQGAITIDVDTDDDGNAEDVPIDIPVPNEMITNTGAVTVSFSVSHFEVFLTDVPLLGEVVVSEEKPPSTLDCTLSSTSAVFPVN